jgi:hypothetical protein
LKSGIIVFEFKDITRLALKKLEFRVDKRIPLIFPVLMSDKFCSVIPTNSDSSFDLTLRFASITSRLTIIVIRFPI